MFNPRFSEGGSSCSSKESWNKPTTANLINGSTYMYYSDTVPTSTKKAVIRRVLNKGPAVAMPSNDVLPSIPSVSLALSYVYIRSTQ